MKNGYWVEKGNGCSKFWRSGVGKFIWLDMLLGIIYIGVLNFYKEFIKNVIAALRKL